MHREAPSTFHATVFSILEMVHGVWNKNTNSGKQEEENTHPAGLILASVKSNTEKEIGIDILSTLAALIFDRGRADLVARGALGQCRIALEKRKRHDVPSGPGFGVVMQYLRPNRRVAVGKVSAGCARYRVNAYRLCGY